MYTTLYNTKIILNYSLKIEIYNCYFLIKK
jgi:hypothetical protein